MTSPSSLFTDSHTLIEDDRGISHADGGTDANSVDTFSAAYDKYANAIFRHCYFHTFNREQAKNLLQETFIKTWGYLVAGNEIEHMRAFLYKVATNLIINDARKKKSVSLEALQEEGFDPGEDDENIGRDWMAEKQAMTALQEIAEPYRTAVTLRHIEGFHPAEIAQITGVSANVASVRIHRGLKQLRLALQSEKKHGDSFSIESSLMPSLMNLPLPL